MKYNDNILERIGEFYADLEIGNWTDYLSKKPQGFDHMDFNDKMHYALDMMIKIDDIMEDPWEVVKTWSRRINMKNQSFDTFDKFMDHEIDYLKQKQQVQSQNAPKKHFWNRWYKQNV